MAVIFADGFDWYASADCTKRGWTATNGSTAFVTSTAAARTGSGQGATVSFTGSAAAPGPWYKAFGANYTTGVLGFGVHFNGVTVPSRVVCCILDGTTEQISVRTNASGVLTVTRNGTVLATGTTVLNTTGWYYIELKFTIHGSTGTVELKLNGAAEIASAAGLDTTNTANVQWNGFSIGVPSNNIALMFDDLYCLDASTGSNTTFLGPVQVAARAVNGNGNHAQWTSNGGSNAGNVSEPFEDGDVSFNQSSTAGLIDTFTTQDLPAASGSVLAVQVHNVAKQDGGAARTVAPVVRISSTDYAGTGVALSTSYQMLTQVYDVSPATSSAWTVSEANGAETGYKLIS